MVAHMATYGLGRLLPGVASIIYLSLLAHIFGPREYGYYALALGLATLLSAFVGGGLGYAILRIYPSAPPATAQSLVLGVLVLWLVASAAFAGLSLVAWLLLYNSSYLPLNANEFVVSAVVLFVPLSGMTILGELLRAQLRPLMFVALQAIYSIGSLAIGLPLVLVYHASIVAAIWSATAASLSGVVVVLLLLGLHRAVAAGVRPARMREITAFAWPIALGSLSFWSFRLSDRYVLSAFVSATQVGIYSSVFDLADRMVSAVREPILLTIQPMAIHEVDSDKGLESIQALRDGATAYLAATGFLILSVIFLGPTMVHLFLGPAFVSGVGLLDILVVAAALTGFVNLGILLLTLAMRPRAVAVAQTAAAVAKLTINLVAIPFGGILAAAATTLGMNLLLGGLLLASSGRRGIALLRDRRLRRALTGLVASCLIGETTQWLLVGTDAANAWALVAALLAYGAAIWWAIGFSGARRLAQSIAQQRNT